MSEKINNEDVLCGAICENGEYAPVYCNRVTGECYFADPVNELYVKAVPDIVGYKLTQELTVSFVPAGTRNNDRLIVALPQFAAYTAIPQDSEVLIHMSSKETLTDEDVMFLYDVGAAFVDCKRSGSAPIRATFEEEIIGNYTVRLGDIFGHNIPEGRYHDEWVCFYNNPNLDRTDMDHLNTHDLMALYSLCGFIRKNPNENFLLDKDFGLLKKVLAANEIFSNAMHEVVPEFIRKYRAAISRGIGRAVLRINEKKFYTSMELSGESVSINDFLQIPYGNQCLSEWGKYCG